MQDKGLTVIGIRYTVANLVVALGVAVPLWRAVQELPDGKVMADVAVAAASEAVFD